MRMGRISRDAAVVIPANSGSGPGQAPGTHCVFNPLEENGHRQLVAGATHVLLQPAKLTIVIASCNTCRVDRASSYPPLYVPLLCSAHRQLVAGATRRGGDCVLLQPAKLTIVIASRNTCRVDRASSCPPWYVPLLCSAHRQQVAGATHPMRNNLCYKVLEKFHCAFVYGFREGGMGMNGAA